MVKTRTRRVARAFPSSADLSRPNGRFPLVRRARLIGLARDLRLRMCRWLNRRGIDDLDTRFTISESAQILPYLLHDVDIDDKSAAINAHHKLLVGQSRATYDHAKFDAPADQANVPLAEPPPMPPVIGASVTPNLLKELIDNMVAMTKRRTNQIRKRVAHATLQRIDGNTNAARKALFQRLRRGLNLPAAMVRDPTTGFVLSSLAAIARVLQQQWSTVLSRHAQAPPDWQSFCNFVDPSPEFNAIQYFGNAPCRVPSGAELHAAAAATKGTSAPGLDGWLPAELKWLPEQAWDLRSDLLELCARRRRFPSSYTDVAMIAIPKRDGGHEPLKQRLLTIFSAIYRVTAKAWYRLLIPWLRDTLDPDLHGGVEGHEAMEAAWDAQADIEAAII